MRCLLLSGTQLDQFMADSACTPKASPVCEIFTCRLQYHHREPLPCLMPAGELNINCGCLCRGLASKIAATGGAGAPPAGGGFGGGCLRLHAEHRMCHAFAHYKGCSHLSTVSEQLEGPALCCAAHLSLSKKMSGRSAAASWLTGSEQLLSIYRLRCCIRSKIRSSAASLRSACLL